ncbi:arylsulfatase [Klebsiella pneumoniae]|uniref:Arylsulfatase n=1 Tax=Klebsiella pneumoniae TaxID=573 RepID=A0A377XEQ9_KLEPN|nr:arylsulfatase [Klebsiella pneumoniae]
MINSAPLSCQWFMYGGGVLGVGLLLGLVLPHLVPSRKRKDRWMN